MRLKNTLAMGCAIVAIQSSAAMAQDSETQQLAQADTRAQSEFSVPQNEAIVVTARRREELLSETPVSITALSGDDLSQKSITSLEELTQSTPGLIFGQSGGSSNPQVVIRGQSRANLGDAAQPVLTYFNDVPLPYVSQIIPTYDLASVQVLKGPQGTLFGRNSTSGALLVYSKEPTFDTEGYLMGGYGNYNRIEAEGAVNVPIVTDTLAIRVAGRYEKRDGFSRSIYNGQELENKNDRAFRVSARFETGNLKNTTVYDYSEWKRNGDAAFLNYIYPGSFYASGVNVLRLPPVPPFQPLDFAGNYDCGTSPTCDVDLALAQQQALGRRFNQETSESKLDTRVTGLNNTTTLDIGAITLKNIIGYRTALSDNTTATDGTAMTLTVAENHQSFGQFSEEFQIQGTFWDDRIDAIIGAFYLNSRPNGEQGLIVAPFVEAASVLPPQFRPAFVVQGFREQTSYALFGQTSVEIIQDLNIDLGVRHTWDETEACANSYTPASPFVPQTTPLATRDQCLNGGTIEIPGVGPVDILGDQISSDSKAWTWNLGANYKFNNSIFGYAVARRGYRAGGVNTPVLAGTLAQFQSYDPETVIDFEIGLKTTWSAGALNGTFNIDVFRSTFRDTQRGVNGLNRDFDGSGDTSDDPAGGSIIINAGKARVQGVDVDGSVSYQGLTLSAFLTYNDQKYLTTGTPEALAGTTAFPSDPDDVAFPYAPKLTGGGTISYEHDLGPDQGILAFSLDGYFASRTYFSPFLNDKTLSSDPYEVFNTRLDFREIYGSNVSLALYMRNIFDKNYAIGAANSATASGYNSFFYSAPRTYGLQVRVDF